jgi:creatinine amidohydrolase
MRLFVVISIVTGLLALGFPAGAQSGGAVELENLTQPEVTAREVRVLVLPIGSCEPHANHLPYANDALVAGTLAARAVAKANEEGAKVLVLPTMPYGVNTNVREIAYAQSIRPATMMQFVKDVVDTAEKHGTRKFVIVNSHGGNRSTLEATLRELFASHPGLFVVLVSAYETWSDEQPQIVESPGGHAGEAETSIALHLHPQRVKMERAVPPRNPELKLESLKASYTKFLKPWKYVSDNTGVGDPTKATPEKGRKLVDIFVNRMSTFLIELSHAELTETFPY